MIRRFRTGLRDRFRTERLTRGRSVATADRKTAWEFLQDLLEAVPYQVHTILTDNSIQFAGRVTLKKNRSEMMRTLKVVAETMSVVICR